MTTIISPLPGTFYLKPSPEEPAFKTKGDKVEIGDIIGLIEVMKTFIEIKAEVAGEFSEYAVADATPVQPGETLANLEAS